MRRTRFSAGVLPVDLAKALREEVERIDRATEAYTSFCDSRVGDYSDESIRQQEFLSRQIELARAGLCGVVRSILRQDEEAKRHV